MLNSLHVCLNFTHMLNSLHACLTLHACIILYTHVCVTVMCLQVLSHLSIPDEKFFFAQANAKVQYVGVLNDGQYYLYTLYLKKSWWGVVPFKKHVCKHVHMYH